MSSMARGPILIEDMNDQSVYHRIEPSFFSNPISNCAKGVYLTLTSLGRTEKHTVSELCSMCADPAEDVIRSVEELDRAGFDISNLIRA